MVTITLTPEQATQLAMAPRREVTVTLTREQVNAIKRSFPWFATNKMTMTFPMGGKAAPFIPGGSVVSAAISGIGHLGQALGS